eukprot:s2499_g4.t1
MAAPAMEVEERESDYRDVLNLLPVFWLPVCLRELVMFRVILTGFLEPPWLANKAVDEVPSREQYSGNHGKGGRPKKHQQVQARSAEAEIRWIMKDILSDQGKPDFRKTCVCSASSQLSRERQRLLKLEQRCIQRSLRLADREDAVNDLEGHVWQREDGLSGCLKIASLGLLKFLIECASYFEKLAEKRESFLQEELSVASALQALEVAQIRAGELQAANAAQDREVQQQQRQLVRTKQRLEKRLERVERERASFVEERTALTELEESEQGKTPPISSEALRAKARSGEPIAAYGLGWVRAWQTRLEPLRREMQTKEADLDERQSLIQRRRTALQQREERLQLLTSELAEAHDTEAESRKTSAEKEKRLEEIWEQIYQRQSVLEAAAELGRCRSCKAPLHMQEYICNRAARAESGVGPAGRSGVQRPRVKTFEASTQTDVEFAEAEVQATATTAHQEVQVQMN